MTRSYVIILMLILSTRVGLVNAMNSLSAIQLMKLYETV